MSTGAHNLRYIDAVDRTGLYTVSSPTHVFLHDKTRFFSEILHISHVYYINYHVQMFHDNHKLFHDNKTHQNTW